MLFMPDVPIIAVSVCALNDVADGVQTITDIQIANLYWERTPIFVFLFVFKKENNK